MKKKTLSLLLIILLNSCSHVKENPSRDVASNPKTDCNELVESILSAKVRQKYISRGELEPKKKMSIDELKERGILKFREKVFTYNLPSVDWFNSIKHDLISRMKTWNNNRYPIFYLSKDKNYEKVGKEIAALLEKQSNGTISDSEVQQLSQVMKEIRAFINYQNDLQKIVDERVTLQIAIDKISKVFIDDDKPIDLELIIRRDGLEFREVVTLRKKDHNRKLVLKKYHKLLKEFNGNMFKPGKLEERVLKQSMLRDIVTIYHREVEYAVKNKLPSSIKNDNDPLSSLYSQLNSALENSDFDPSSYGMFKIDDDVFLAELMRLTRADVGVVKTIQAKNRVQNALRNYLQVKPQLEDPQKVGLLRHAYLSVSNLTVRDVANFGIQGVIAITAYNYFVVDSKTSTTVLENGTNEINTATATEITPIDPLEAANNGPGVHQTQLNNSNKLSMAYIKSQFDFIQSKITHLVN